MSLPRPLALLTLLTLSVTPTAQVTAEGDGQRIESPAHRVALVELFTSEGCSSCPPADRWLSELKHDERIWDRLVPVAFHVDYWDYIGWPDRFATKAFGERQRNYARGGNVASVYTPGFVVHGEEWRGWFRYLPGSCAWISPATGAGWRRATPPPRARRSRWNCTWQCWVSTSARR